MFITLLTGTLLLAVVWLDIIVMACPSQCTCTGKFTNCYGQDLKEVPQDLPMMTEVLDIQNNEIRILHKKSLNRLKNLKELKLRFNKIQVIEPGTFRRMPQLQKIDLAANLIQKLPNRIFSGATGLTQLDLSENYLEKIDNLFNGLTFLERLDLGSNKIKGITNNSFRDLNQVMFLILSNNNISSIAKKAFKNMNMLSYLVIRNNPLKNIDDILSDNDRLSYVELANCELKAIPHGLPLSLRYLQLGENNITRVEASDLLPYKLIGILILDENQISYVEDGAFSHMSLLQDLWLNVNKLETIPGFLPRGIKSLYLDHNNIDKIATNDIAFGAKLETLSIRDNELQEISSESFRNPEFLKKLYLNGNNFTVISSFTFSHMPHLEMLSMNRNTLSLIDTNAFSGLSSLLTLEMAYVIAPRNCIQGNIFKDLRKLRMLDLQLSPGIVQTVLSSEDFLSSLQSLEELNLMDNNVQTLQPFTGVLFSQVETVKLAENKFHCDEKMIWLRNWINANENPKFLSDQVKCYTPLNVRGREISSLHDYEFSTHEILQEPTTKTAPINRFTVIGGGKKSKPKITTAISLATHSPTTEQKLNKSMTVSSSTLERTWPSRKATTTTAIVSTHKIPIRKEHNEFYTFTRKSVKVVTQTSMTSEMKTASMKSSENSHINKKISTTAMTLSEDRAFNKGKMETKAANKDKRTTSKTILKSNVSRNVSVKYIFSTATPITERNTKQRNDNPLKVTAIATTISVIVFVFISIAVIYLIYTKRKKLVYHRARKYQDDGDVVFYITDSEGLRTIPSSNKLTREDRGSVTSRPSEDITNDYDPEMKVYTWDSD